MGFFDRLFKRKPPKPTDDGIYFYVRCNHCERVLHTRLNPKTELSRTDSGFEVRKNMMDDRCFRRLKLTAVFDSNYRVLQSEVDHGTFIDRATWLAEKDQRRRPQSPSVEESPNLSSRDDSI